jgi:hypothetical protein
MSKPEDSTAATAATAASSVAFPYNCEYDELAEIIISIEAALAFDAPIAMKVIAKMVDNLHRSHSAHKWVLTTPDGKTIRADSHREMIAKILSAYRTPQN